MKRETWEVRNSLSLLTPQLDQIHKYLSAYVLPRHFDSILLILYFLKSAFSLSLSVFLMLGIFSQKFQVMSGMSGVFDHSLEWQSYT